VQLREGVLAGRRKNNQELLDGEGVEGIRPNWLEKRKKRQIDWRRGWSHGIGEQARWIGAAATRRRLRIRGAAGHPPSPFPSVLLNLLPRQTHHGGRCRRADPARAAADSRAQNPPTRAVAADSRVAPRPLFSPARSPN